MRKIFNLYETFEYFASNGPMPEMFFNSVRERVEKNYGKVVEKLQRQDLLTYEQLSQWSEEDASGWWVAQRPRGQSTVFVCGFNNRGQLGSTDNEVFQAVTISQNLTKINPIEVVLGQQCLFALTRLGEVWSCGEYANGRLGYPQPENLSPSLSKLRKIENLHSIKAISANSNGKHVLALTFNGVVFSWGDSEFGQTGHGTRDTIEKPRLVQALRGNEVVKISAGSRHSACINKRGHLFTWGCGRQGKLGHPISTGTDHPDVTKPKRVDHFRHLKVVDVACGDSDGHTIALTQGESGLNVWSWGRQGAILGRYSPVESPSHLPGLIPFHNEVQVVQVFAGASFSAVLTENGEVFTWGKGGYYRLGHESEENAFAPLKVNTFDEKVIKVAVGALHTICLTESNAVIGWGDNEKSQLAQRDILVKQPTQVHQFDAKDRVLLAAGSAHTVLTVENPEPSVDWPIPEPIPIKYTALESFHRKELCIGRQVLLELSEQIVQNYQILELDHFHAIAGSIQFQTKENLLRRLLMSSMWTDVKHGPTIQINRVVKEPSDPSLPKWMGSVTWQVIHEILSDDSNLQAFKLNGRCWKIRFIGESVDDCGGGFSDSIAEICQEVQDKDMGIPLLIPSPNTLEHDETTREFVLRPLTRKTPEIKRLYGFLGLLIGAAIRQGSPLSLRVDKSMWKLLRGEALTPADLFAMDESLRQKIEFVRSNQDFEAIEIDGTINSCTGEVVKIVPGNLTLENKQEFLEKALEFRLNEFNSGMEIVRQYVLKVIHLPLLSLFTSDELNTMITGQVDIPIELLKKVTVYKGITADSDYASWFWQILQEFTCKERQESDIKR